MLTEILVICATLLFITLGVLGFLLRASVTKPVKKTVQEPEKMAQYVTRDKFTEWKSAIESRMKSVENQWDDTWAKMRRKEARYMRENKFDGKDQQEPAVSGVMEPPMTGEELEKAQNRMKLGLE